MYRTLLGILSVFAVALLIVGLTFSASIEEQTDFRFINGTEPKTLDPHLATGQPEGRILMAVFEGLTRREAKTMKPAPGMAESWEISEDGKTYTFHLRKDAVWTDGRPVTAGDFVYSWKRLLDPALGSEYAYILHPVRYAKALNTFEGHAELLRTKVRPEIKNLARAPIDAKKWQRFIADTHSNAALQGVTDPVITELLSRRQGSITPDELGKFSERLASVERDLARRGREARDHFGVDAGIYARDDHTLVVELEAPTPYFLEITSFYSTMPAPRWLVEKPERKSDWFLPEHIVSNGPFRLKRWVVNDRIRLEKNDRYWGREAVRSHSVDALSIENATTSLNLYLTGEVDWLPSNYPTDLVDQLKSREDFYSNPGMIVYYYRFNTTRPPLDDERVRLAINMAVDRRLIVDEVLGLGQIPAYTFVPPGMAGYEAPESRIRRDHDRARRLLAEAGYPGGRGFPEVGILYNTHESHKKIAEVIADQLRRHLGIQATAYNQEWQSYLSTVITMDYFISRAGWIGDYADPNTFLDMWVTNGGNNNTGFSSSLYDRLIRYAGDAAALLEEAEPSLFDELKEPGVARRLAREARKASGAEARLEGIAKLRMHLLKEAEAILVQDEFPIMPLYFYVVSGLVRPEVQGFYSTLRFEDGTTAPNLQDIHPLRDLWVAGGAR